MQTGERFGFINTLLNIIIAISLFTVIALLLVLFINSGADTNIFKAVSEQAHTEITAAAPSVTDAEASQPSVVPREMQPEQSEITTGADSIETPPDIAGPPSLDFERDFFTNHLIIGDSIATGLTGYDLVPANNVFAQVGLNPQSVMTTELRDIFDPEKAEKTAAQKAAELQPEFINIMLGTNGIAFLSAEYMARQMSLFIDRLEEAAPNSEIVLISIPPITAEYEAENLIYLADIIEYNERLRELAEERNLRFIDVFAAWCDETGYFSKEYAEVDGLHFKPSAYRVLLSWIQWELSGGAG